MCKRFLLSSSHSLNILTLRCYWLPAFLYSEMKTFFNKDLNPHCFSSLEISLQLGLYDNGLDQVSLSSWRTVPRTLDVWLSVPEPMMLTMGLDLWWSDHLLHQGLTSFFFTASKLAVGASILNSQGRNFISRGIAWLPHAMHRNWIV